MNKQNDIALLPNEVSQHSYDAVVTLATTFVGEAPVEYLAGRMQVILEKNTWLAARLKTHVDNELCLTIPTETCFSAVYQVLNISDVCDGSEIGALIQAIYTPPLTPKLANLFSKQGFKCIDNNQPLFKIRLCKADDNSFVLLLSMSHVLGDGATLYRLYQMLSMDEEVIALTPKRVAGFQESLIENGYIAGSCLQPSVSASQDERAVALFNSRAMRSTPMSRLMTGFDSLSLGVDGNERSASYAGGLFNINLDWIDTQKQLVASSLGSWVSTNDILCSWFMSMSKPSLGIVAIDSRNHVDALSDKHAGNYQMGLLYTQDEYQAPELIRHHLRVFPNNRDKAVEMKPVETVALVSNWSSFYKQLNIGDNCQQLMHFPLVPPELDTPSVIDSTMIVFRPNEGQLAVAMGVDGLENYLTSGVLDTPLFSGK